MNSLHWRSATWRLAKVLLWFGCAEIVTSSRLQPSDYLVCLLQFVGHYFERTLAAVSCVHLLSYVEVGCPAVSVESFCVLFSMRSTCLSSPVFTLMCFTCVFPAGVFVALPSSVCVLCLWCWDQFTATRLLA